MLDWIGDTIFAIVTAVPALFVDQDSPRFFLIRGMFGLILNRTHLLEPIREVLESDESDVIP